MKQIKFLLIYAKNYKGSLITIISMLLLVGVQLLIPWIIKTMVGAVTDPTGEQISMALITRLALLALVVYIHALAYSFCAAIWRMSPAGAWWPMRAS